MHVTTAVTLYDTLVSIMADAFVMSAAHVTVRLQPVEDGDNDSMAARHTDGGKHLMQKIIAKIGLRCPPLLLKGMTAYGPIW